MAICFTMIIMDDQGKALMDRAAMESYVDDLIRDRADPHIKPENLPQTKQILLSQVNEAINMHLVNLLSPQDKIALDDLLVKNPSNEELDKFFLEKVPNLQVEIASALLNFRAAYLYAVTSGQPPAPPQPAPVKEEKN